MNKVYLVEITEQLNDYPPCHTTKGVFDRKELAEEYLQKCLTHLRNQFPHTRWSGYIFENVLNEPKEKYECGVEENL